MDAREGDSRACSHGPATRAPSGTICTHPLTDMPRKSKLLAANLDGDADGVEAAFYDALQSGDIDKLMACWADEDDIVYIHPNGPRVVGPIAIRATFEAKNTNNNKQTKPQQNHKKQKKTNTKHNGL